MLEGRGGPPLSKGSAAMAAPHSVSKSRPNRGASWSIKPAATGRAGGGSSGGLPAIGTERHGSTRAHYNVLISTCRPVTGPPVNHAHLRALRSSLILCVQPAVLSTCQRIPEQFSLFSICQFLSFNRKPTSPDFRAVPPNLNILKHHGSHSCCPHRAGEACAMSSTAWFDAAASCEHCYLCGEADWQEGAAPRTIVYCSSCSVACSHAGCPEELGGDMPITREHMDGDLDWFCSNVSGAGRGPKGAWARLTKLARLARPSGKTRRRGACTACACGANPPAQP